MSTSRQSESYLRLRDFIENRMRMSHVYQPAMLIECLNRGGSATVTDIARNLLGQSSHIWIMAGNVGDGESENE